MEDAFIVNDLLHTHMKYGRECTVLTTRCTDPAALGNYGQVLTAQRLLPEAEAAAA